MSIQGRTANKIYFDGWQVQDFLGSGSGGRTAVFRMERSRAFTEVSALKVVNIIEENGSWDALSPAYKAQFERRMKELQTKALREVELMYRLRGTPTIVSYFDYRVERFQEARSFGCDLLIRMELLNDLRGLQQASYPFSERDIIQVGKDICAALQVCHAAGIVHRDIKPANIFRDRQGRCKLGDFGVSRIVESGTGASTAIGTEPYAAPEQFLPGYDQRVDIYSLGLTLYELANNNCLPFSSSPFTDDIAIQRRLSGEPLPAPKNASPALRAVILKACAYKREERYRNADELLHALEQAERPGTSGYTAYAPAPDEKPGSTGTAGQEQWQTQAARPSQSGAFWQEPKAAGSASKQDTAKNKQKKPGAAEKAGKQHATKSKQEKPKTAKKSGCSPIFFLVIVIVAIVGFRFLDGSSGDIGDNLTWKLRNGTLTISGTGAMTDFRLSSDLPWEDKQDKIETIEIESGVTSIGDSVFYGCSALTDVTIPDSVETIGDNAFRYCEALTDVTIPDSVETIGDDVFYGCDALTDIEVDANNPSYCSADGVLFDKAMTTLIQYPTGNSRTAYTVPSSVTSIDRWAFCYSDALAGVTIPNSVTSIEYGAFSHCDALVSVTIPDSVTEIDDSAFEDCNALVSVVISGSVTEIGDSAFGSCDALTGITVDAGNPNYCSDAAGVLFDKAMTTLIQYPIGSSTVWYQVPDSVTSIERKAFMYCTALTGVELRNVTSIGDFAFYNCRVLTDVGLSCVVEIKSYAFSNCDALTGITLPESIRSIEDRAFSECDALADIYYAGTEDQWYAITFGDDVWKNTNKTVHYGSTGTA